MVRDCGTTSSFLKSRTANTLHLSLVICHFALCTYLLRYIDFSLYKRSRIPIQSWFNGRRSNCIAHRRGPVIAIISGIHHHRFGAVGPAAHHCRDGLHDTGRFPNCREHARRWRMAARRNSRRHSRDNNPEPGRRDLHLPRI